MPFVVISDRKTNALTNNWKKINYLSKYFSTAQITTAQVLFQVHISDLQLHNCHQLHTKITPLA